MWQEILITDVTRMSGDRVCVAGIDHQGKTIRPLLPYPDVLCETHLYVGDEVIIRPRAVVNLFLEADPQTEVPHTEDHLWINSNQREFLRFASDTSWMSALKRTSFESVFDIFKTQLHKNKTVQPGSGERSLGTIKPISIDKFGYYRLTFGDKEGDKFTLSFTDQSNETFANIPITDLSLRYYLDYLRVQGRLHPAKIRALMEQKLANTEVWLRLGLTRPFQKSNNDQKWCYIQVTGFYTFPDYLEGRCFADFRPDWF